MAGLSPRLFLSYYDYDMPSHSYNTRSSASANPAMVALLDPLKHMLDDIQLGVTNRSNSGRGVSQCFGFVPRRALGVGEAMNNYRYKRLYAELKRIAGIICPGNNYTCFSVNINYEALTHIDAHNDGSSTTVSFGDFTGGELVVGDQAISTRYNPVTFNAFNTPHSVNKCYGTRYSIVMYRHKYNSEFQRLYAGKSLAELHSICPKANKHRPASSIKIC